jgi:hypothetical protein
MIVWLLSGPEWVVSLGGLAAAILGGLAAWRASGTDAHRHDAILAEIANLRERVAKLESKG